MVDIESVSFEKVSILNGGFDRYKLENKITNSVAVNYPKNNCVSRLVKNFFCDKSEVLNNIDNKNICIINAFRKTLHNVSEAINYGRPGHIKNSINIPALK